MAPTASFIAPTTIVPPFYRHRGSFIAIVLR